MSIFLLKTINHNILSSINFKELIRLHYKIIIYLHTLHYVGLGLQLVQTKVYNLILIWTHSLISIIMSYYNLLARLRAYPEQIQQKQINSNTQLLMSLKGLSHSFTPSSAAHVGPTTPTRVPFHLVHSYTYHSLPLKVRPFPSPA